MKRLLLLAALLVAPSMAHAFPGEVFKVEAVGTEYCGDFASSRFSAKNNVDIWARLDNEHQLTVSYTPGFDSGTTFPIYGYFYYVGSTSAAFVGAGSFAPGSFVTIRGTAALNKKTGGVTTLTGTFIQSEVPHPGCFSSGTFTSKKLS